MFIVDSGIAAVELLPTSLYCTHVTDIFGLPF